MTTNCGSTIITHQLSCHCLHGSTKCPKRVGEQQYAGTDRIVCLHECCTHQRVFPRLDLVIITVNIQWCFPQISVHRFRVPAEHLRERPRSDRADPTNRKKPNHGETLVRIKKFGQKLEKKKNRCRTFIYQQQLCEFIEELSVSGRARRQWYGSWEVRLPAKTLWSYTSISYNAMPDCQLLRFRHSPSRRNSQQFNW